LLRECQRRRNPDEVKEIYVRDGATFLKEKIECPPPFKKELSYQPSQPPDPGAARSKKVRNGPRCLPAWWNSMYSRQAKGIDEHRWSGLMAKVTWQEVLATIRSLDSESGWSHAN